MKSTIDQHSITQLLVDLAPRLIERQLKLATAESCTGGWVSKCITDLDGSSLWFDCALVTYSNQAKINLLGVQGDTLSAHGAVSQPVVKEMVLGLLDRCEADLGLSISGVAGPGGGTDNKPVGTVWIAWARPGMLIEAMRFQFNGNREQIRLQAVYESIQGIQRILNDTAQ